MILHLVLFTPRADLGTGEQQALVSALDDALGTIPSVVQYRLGRRIATGAAYDALGNPFEYCAVLEFADREALVAYLSHPAHEELGRLFYTTSVDRFAGDYDAVESEPAAALRRWVAAPDLPRLG